MGIVIGILVFLGIIMVVRGFLRGLGSRGAAYGITTILERFIKWGISAVVFVIIIMVALSAFN